MSFDLKIINSDLVIKDGALQLVSDSEKLIQDILKMCLTTVGSNAYSPWYGSALSRSMIGNPSTGSVLIHMAKSQLTNSFENLKTLQDMQMKTYQKVSGDELLSAILDISIGRDQNDPRQFNISIKALNKSNKVLTTAFRANTI